MKTDVILRNVVQWRRKHHLKIIGVVHKEEVGKLAIITSIRDFNRNLNKDVRENQFRNRISL